MQKLQELKFYCPLTIRREPDYDEEYDYSEEYPEISPFAAAGYADAVQKRLEGHCSDDGKRGLMEYYNREKSVSEKVYSGGAVCLGFGGWVGERVLGVKEME